jgi:hypothetical protein
MSQNLQITNKTAHLADPKFILDGRFELLSLLGDGYQSRVYLANVFPEENEIEGSTATLPD